MAVTFFPEQAKPTGELFGVEIARVATIPYFVVTQLRGQIDYLIDRGVRITLITGPGPELSQLRFSDTLVCVSLPFSRALAPWRDLIALFKLFRILSTTKFEIIHSTTPKAGVLCALAGFLARVPIRLHTFTGQPWVNMKGPISSLARLGDRLIGMLNTRCYADSISQRDFLVTEKIISSTKISVIGAGSLAGVDLKRFSAERWTQSEKASLRELLQINADGKIISFVGRLTLDKGILELLSAFGDLTALDYDVYLLLVGPLDQDRGGAGRLSKDDLENNPRVRYVGYTDCPERYLAVSNILCLPSYREGFGTVVVEAAAMGVPTVGTDIYGLRDAIVDGETGVLVPARDANALSGALRELLDAPDVAVRMGEMARRRCLELFDSRLINQELAKEYEGLLRGRRTN
jgi:glycosyltransferase involved in cell wall biosynthesis